MPNTGSSSNNDNIYNNQLIEIYNNKIKINPYNVDLYIEKINILRKQGMLDEALKTLDIIIKIHPEYVFAHFNRIDILNEQGRYDEAKEVAGLDTANIHDENASPYY